MPSCHQVFDHRVSNALPIQGFLPGGKQGGTYSLPFFTPPVLSLILRVGKTITAAKGAALVGIHRQEQRAMQELSADLELAAPLGHVNHLPLYEMSPLLN
jgi:hypothetical protein